MSSSNLIKSGDGRSTPFKFECTDVECIENIPKTPIRGLQKLQDYSIHTPSTSSSSHNYIENFSEINLSPNTKSTVLKGVACYVDTRMDKEDMTGSVQEELRSLGATIEKNFTKKVRFVVFKEGRKSTFLRAKKEGIPLVGVRWIEGCKRVRGVADPALHPPVRMEKYYNILPFQTVKKRRSKFFNPNSTIRKAILQNYHDPSFVPTLNGKLLASRKAATESINNTPIKRPRTKATTTRPRQLVNMF